MVSSQFVGPDVGRDAKQPNPRGTALLELFSSVPGPQKGLLRQVFGTMAIPGQPQRKPVHVGDMFCQPFAHRSPSGFGGASRTRSSRHFFRSRRRQSFRQLTIKDERTAKWLNANPRILGTGSPARRAFGRSFDSAVIEPSSLQFSLELVVCDPFERVAAAHRPTRAMRTRTERRRMAPASHMKTFRAHRTGDQAGLIHVGSVHAMGTFYSYDFLSQRRGQKVECLRLAPRGTIPASRQGGKFRIGGGGTAICGERLCGRAVEPKYTLGSTRSCRAPMARARSMGNTPGDSLVNLERPSEKVRRNAAILP